MMIVAYLAQGEAVAVCLGQRQAVLAAVATAVAAATFARVVHLRNVGRIWMQGQQCFCSRDRRTETSDHNLHKTADLQYFVHHTSDN